jgi:excisionase family DNA binding protein
MPTTTPFDNYLDLVEAARELAIHPQSLRRLIKQKKIPARLFAGKYLIERDKLEMFKSTTIPGRAGSRSAACCKGLSQTPTLSGAGPGQHQNWRRKRRSFW